MLSRVIRVHRPIARKYEGFVVHAFLFNGVLPRP